ncbi:MAG: 5-formyltetrahydrofolate cyclo-ligase [Myxococcota bacterium]
MLQPWPDVPLPDDKDRARASVRALLRSTPPLRDPLAASRRLREFGVMPARGRVGVYVTMSSETPLGWLSEPESAGRVAYVRCRDDGNLELVAWDGVTPMQKDAGGVMAPGGDALVAPSELGAVLVPGLAFDPTGGRLGRGRGFYDRALAQWDHALRVAVTREARLFSRVPTAPHDQPVDVVVTEERVHWTGARGLRGPGR